MTNWLVYVGVLVQENCTVMHYIGRRICPLSLLDYVSHQLKFKMMMLFSLTCQIPSLAAIIAHVTSANVQQAASIKSSEFHYWLTIACSQRKIYRH